MLIAVANLESRSGKSICAVNLACELADIDNLCVDRWQGKHTVVLVDSSVNGTATRYWSGGRLPVSGESLSLEDSKDLERWIQRIRAIKVDYVVVDAPSNAIDVTKAIVDVSDLVVIPCSNYSGDLVAIASTMELVGKARSARLDKGPKCLLVPAGVDAGTMTRIEIEGALRKFGEPLGRVIYHRSAFMDALSAGRWIGDFAPDSGAHQDIKALAASVRTTDARNVFSKPPVSWIDGAKEKRKMHSTASMPVFPGWLAQKGPKELELLVRAIAFQPSAPILLTDDDRQSREASVGVSTLLGLPREKIIGRCLDDFAEPSFRPVISERWQSFLEHGEQQGTLLLLGPDGGPREVEYSAKGNVLPTRHLLVLKDRAKDPLPAWVQDFALCLLDRDGLVVAWYAGAERIYGYKSDQVLGQHVSLFYPDEDTIRAKLDEKLKRAVAEGHRGNECGHARKDGSRFWGNAITMALKRRGRAFAGLRQSRARL